MNWPGLIIVPSIHPTVVKPCGYCGEEIKGYTRVVQITTVSPASKPDEILLHPDCVALFSSWILKEVEFDKELAASIKTAKQKLFQNSK